MLRLVAFGPRREEPEDRLPEDRSVTGTPFSTPQANSLSPSRPIISRSMTHKKSPLSTLVGLEFGFYKYSFNWVTKYHMNLQASRSPPTLNPLPNGQDVSQERQGRQQACLASRLSAGLGEGLGLGFRV